MGFDFFMVNKPEKAIGYKPEMPDRPDWFRFSWRGMEAVFNGMRLARVLEGKTPKPLISEGPDPDKESKLAMQSSIGIAVPYWKFADNSGWLVSPRECDIIASGLEECLNLSPEKLRPRDDWPDGAPLDGFHDLLREWVAFNRQASEHGGYRVR